MKRIAIAILGSVLSGPSCWGAEGYSFDAYLSERGGCEAQRQILDKRLKEIRFDYVSPGKANQGQGIDLFGQAAADWTEGDIQGVLAVFRRCEEQVFRRGLDRPAQQNRKAVARDFEVLIARGASRIEETLREIISVDRGNTVRANAQAAGEGRPRREEAPADRWNRDWTQRPIAEREQDLARLQSLTDRADAADLERGRRAEIRGDLLREARRVARERERDRMKAETAPPAQRAAAPPEPPGQPRTAEAFAFAPRPIMDRNNCPVTREGFDQVQRGMPLERVEAVIGCRGTLTTTSISADLGKIEVHLWDDRKTGTITVQFLNSLVYAKSQVGLN